MTTDDPWSWTVNDLIAELCHSKQLYQAANVTAENTPDGVTLEDQLREQHVTGATFLSAVNSNTIRTELGIPNLGQRLALVSVIKLLRGRSNGYTQHSTSTGVKALNINNDGVSTVDSLHSFDTSGRKRQKVTHITPTPLMYSLLAQDLQRQVVDGSGEFDYLLRWQTADRPVAEHVKPANDPTTTEIEDFTDDDDSLEDEEQAAEVEEEEPENPVRDKIEPQNRAKLNQDEIVNILNEYIEHYTNTWTPEQEAQRGEKLDPVAMWEDADAAGTRHQLIEKYKSDRAYYQQRLDNLCDQVLQTLGSNAEKVCLQCRNLEETISMMEFSDWLVGIYSLAPDKDTEDESPERSTNHAGSTEYTESKRENEHLTRQTQLAQIIDLGSPTESSVSEQDEMLVDSSPTPGSEIERQTPRSPERFHSTDAVIADTIEPAAKPVPPPPTARTATSRSLAQLGDEPENASIASARRWRWTDLIDSQDRKRVVIKALLELNSDDLEIIRTRLRTVGKADMIREIPASLQMFSRKETKMHGVLQRDMPKIVTSTKLFLCWWLCDNYFRANPSMWHLEELQNCLEEGSPDPSTFCDFLSTVMRTTFSPDALRNPDQPSQREIIEISDDDE
ncbi:hypothetical protein EK21DRAFT_29404, partial [Setomelanomma holmii]